jgi:triacylglycerol lipase
MLRLMLNETASTVRCVFHPLERVRKPTPRKRPKDLPKTLLVHGLMGTANMFYPLARRLYLQGIPEIHFADYPSSRIGLDQIIDHLEQIVAPHEGPWNLIGHSLGAIAIRAWLKERGSAPTVRTFIAMGAPFRGTEWHTLAPKHLKEAFDPDSERVKRLNNIPEPNGFHIIRAKHDQNIRPSAMASLDNVPETVFDHIGHNGLVNHPTVMREVWRLLSQT